MEVPAVHYILPEAPNFNGMKKVNIFIKYFVSKDYCWHCYLYSQVI